VPPLYFQVVTYDLDQFSGGTSYQAESDLLALLGPHYSRSDQEGRTLLHELFQSSGDIRVEGSVLRVILAPLSSPHRTLAIGARCHLLNDTATPFPGTGLRLQFELAPQPPTSMAFPGPRPASEAPEPDKPDTSAQG